MRLDMCMPSPRGLKACKGLLWFLWMHVCQLYTAAISCEI